MSEFIEKKRKPAFIFVPLVLITLGLVVLIYIFSNKEADVWSMLLRIWPLLFIYGGIEGLARQKKAASNTFWIILGLALLLTNFSRISWTAWEIIFSFWPVFVISIGIDFLFNQDHAWQRLIAGMIVIIIMGVLVLVFDTNILSQPLEVTDVKQGYEGATRGTISLRPSLSLIRIHPQVNLSSFIDGTVKRWVGERTNKSYEVVKEEGFFQLESSGMVFLFEPGIKNRAEWDIGVSPRTPISLEVDQIIGEQNYDLTGMDITGFDSNLIVGKINLNLPGSDSFDGKIHVIIGDIVIDVPKNAAFRLVGKPTFGSVRIPEFYKQTGNVYESPGFDQSESQIVLELEQVIGLVIIRQR